MRSGAPGVALVRLTSRLVPSERRRDWLEEWRAELEAAASDASARGEPAYRTKTRLWARSAASVADAFSVRRLRRGGSGSPAFPAFRDALRTVRRQPGFVAAVGLTLALGMGATTAIFSVVDAILLHPLPFHEPDRIVDISVRGGEGMDPALLDALRSESALFESVRGRRWDGKVLSGAGEPRRLGVAVLEPGFLDLLGLSPVLGRSVSAADAVPGRERVIVLGNELWHAAFDADPAIVGRTVRLDGETFEVIGVLPKTLRMLPPALVGGVTPLVASLEADAAPTSVFARLRAGVPVEAAKTRVLALAAALDEEAPLAKPRIVEAGLLNTLGFRHERPALIALSAASVLLLLIACANAAGLLFVRGVARQPELVVRRALGGTGGSIFRQLLGESLVVAVLAGVAGTLIAWWGVRALVVIAPDTIVRWHYNVITLNGRALVFSLIATVVTGLLFGIAPAAWAAGRSAGLPTSSRTVTVSRAHMRMRRAVQVAQLALAAMLLCGAGLLARSFVELVRVDPGFDVAHVTRMDFSAPGSRGDAERQSFVRALDLRVREIPGVTGIGWAGNTGIMFGDELLPDGSEPVPTNGRTLLAPDVDTAYLAVMGIRLLEGRNFIAADLADGAPPTVIIDQDLARSLWPGESAVGRAFRVYPKDDPYNVVGVAADAKLERKDDRDMPWTMYIATARDHLGYVQLAIRSNDPARVIAPAREALYSIDPDRPIYDLKTARQALADTLDMPRFALTLMGIFAVLAMLLAAIGVYGLMSFTVAQRSREIGVRMAVGAGIRTVVREVLASGLALAGAGVVLGTAGAIALSRFIEGMLFGVTAQDPSTYILVVVLLVATTTIALLGPALRAARVNPSTALRQE